MFPPLDIPFEYRIEHVTFGILNVMFRLNCLLRLSTGDFQALQLIVLVVFGDVNEPLACMLVHFAFWNLAW